MTFAELMSTAPAERWRSLSTEAQDRIGAKVLEWLFAELVADDDGCETSDAERDQAREISDAAFSLIDDEVETAFPGVMWNYPDDLVGYELSDRSGRRLGHIALDEDANTYVFVSENLGEITRAIAPCMPMDCLSPEVLQAVQDGGSCHPVTQFAKPLPIAA